MFYNEHHHNSGGKSAESANLFPILLTTAIYGCVATSLVQESNWAIEVSPKFMKPKKFRELEFRRVAIGQLFYLL